MGDGRASANTHIHADFDPHGYTYPHARIHADLHAHGHANVNTHGYRNSNTDGHACGASRYPCRVGG